MRRNNTVVDLAVRHCRALATPVVLKRNAQPVVRPRHRQRGAPAREVARRVIDAGRIHSEHRGNLWRRTLSGDQQRPVRLALELVTLLISPIEAVQKGRDAIGVVGGLRVLQLHAAEAGSAAVEAAGLLATAVRERVARDGVSEAACHRAFKRGARLRTDRPARPVEESLAARQHLCNREVLLIPRVHRAPRVEEEVKVDLRGRHAARVEGRQRATRAVDGHGSGEALQPTVRDRSGPRSRSYRVRTLFQSAPSRTEEAWHTPKTLLPILSKISGRAHTSGC
eukprot:1259592-Rhodomonas_salina.1